MGFNLYRFAFVTIYKISKVFRLSWLIMINLIIITRYLYKQFKKLLKGVHSLKKMIEPIEV